MPLADSDPASRMLGGVNVVLGMKFQKTALHVERATLDWLIIDRGKQRGCPINAVLSQQPQLSCK
jgi:hypothetical protein